MPPPQQRLRETPEQTGQSKPDPALARPRRLGLRRKILFLGLVVVLALIGLEGAVRVMNRVRLGRWVASDPEQAAANSRLYIGHAWLGQIPQPGVSVTSKGRHININSFGYRGPDFTMAKPSGVIRIACLGGSTTFDVKVTDDEHAWPAKMGTFLRAQLGVPPAEVINAGTNGYAMPQTIIDLSLRTLDVQPDWVICFPGVNDLAYSNRVQNQYGHSHEAIAWPADVPLWKRVLPYSELYNEIDGRIRYARQKRYGNWEGRPVQRHDDIEPAALQAFARNLTTLAGICQAHRISLALVTVRTAYSREQPMELQLELAESDLRDHAHLSLAGHYAGYEAINRLIREAAARHDLLLIDQAAELPAGQEYFADSVHFSDRGAEQFAEFAAARLGPALTTRVTAESGIQER